MTPKDLPSFYSASDAASNQAQRRYIRGLKVHLALLVGTAAVGGISTTEPAYRNALTIVVVALMLAALVLGILLRQARLDDRWFQCRAFAENSKSAAWRFMVLANVSETEFLRDLQEIRDRFTEVALDLAEQRPKGEEITTLMRDQRRGTLAERLTVYRDERIEEQREWYRARAQENARAENIWFMLVLVAEVVAIAIAALAGPFGWTFNPTGAVAALAAALLAWTQTKRFSDLAVSYTVAAQDLSLLSARATAVTDDDALERLVADTENAISREHRLWFARRGHR